MRNIKTGVSVDGIPVIISNRMTKTKGMCCYKFKDGNLNTVRFKFAKCLLDGTYPDGAVKEVITHEYAHHYINTKTNKSQHQITCLKKLAGCLVYQMKHISYMIRFMEKRHIYINIKLVAQNATLYIKERHLKVVRIIICKNMFVEIAKEN